MDSRFGTPEISVSAMDSKAGAPVLGNDGYAIAREILTSDTYVNQGVFLARDAAKMAKRATGDGSTTAIVLADAMVRNGLRMVGAGFEPNAVARGIERAARLVCERLQESAISVTTQRELDVVARQAAGGDTEVGSAVAEAMHRVGGDNVLLEEGGYGPQIEVNVDESFSMAGGFIDPNLIPNRGATEATLENAMVFVSSEEVKDMHAFARVLQQSATAGCPLLAVAPGFDSDVLALIMVNSLNRRATCVPVVAPGHGVTRQDVLEDMAVFTGATLVDAAGLAGFARRGGGLGSAEAVVVGRSTTTVRGGGADPQTLRLRVAALAAGASDAETLHDRDNLDGRRTQLAGCGHAVLRIGAPTDVERRERFRRATDALEATRRALRAGVVPGGGAALLRAGDALPMTRNGSDEAAGAGIVRTSIEEPARLLAANGGWDSSEVAGTLRKSSKDVAFDAINGTYVNGIEAGIVDPTEVVTRAVMVAASTAVTVLRSSVVIAQPLNGGRYAGTVAEGGPANLAMR
jgi:chaperonin GroEL